MTVIDFTAAHVEQATLIAKQNYEEERGFVPALPYVDKLPSLTDFAAKNHGVAMMDGNELLGFFCWEGPWDNHFGLCKGIWSPIHAHGTVKQNRAEIYDRLYQSAAKKLISDNVFSHSVSLYEHDTEAIASFFQNGFGGRCVDAVRETTPIMVPLCSGVEFRKADVGDAEVIADMNNRLVKHLHQTPMFFPYSKQFTPADIIKGMSDETYQYFVAVRQNNPLAYIRIQETGENFACDDASMMNISGAYALPEVRGDGVAVGLLSWLMDYLRERGYLRCGVDFECFNFTARKFWLKHFAAYSNSVVRRIDERICLK